MLIKFNRPTVLGFKTHLIKPGINDLPAEDVAEMQDDEILAGKFDSGELEIVEVEGPKKGLSAIERLAKAPGKEAIKLAAQTVDLVILTGWLEVEKRKMVKEAIRAQISKIKNVKFRDEKDKQKFEKTEKDEE